MKWEYTIYCAGKFWSQEDTCMHRYAIWTNADEKKANKAFFRLMDDLLTFEPSDEDDAVNSVTLTKTRNLSKKAPEVIQRFAYKFEHAAAVEVGHAIDKYFQKMDAIRRKEYKRKFRDAFEEFEKELSSKFTAENQ